MSAPCENVDVIVVGSGPAGVSAAWPLVEAGLEVLMLDASSEALPKPVPVSSLSDQRRAADRWKMELGVSGPVENGGISPKFATPLARAALGGFADAENIQTEGFLALGSHAAGGLSRVWGALAARYGERDLAAFGEQAQGVSEGYDRVARRIGVEGGNEIASSRRAEFTAPIAHLAERHRGLAPDAAFRLVTAPNAVLSAQRGERLGCNRCGQCLYGCGRASIYHSALELPALRRFPNFRYRSAIAVERLEYEAGEQMVIARMGNQEIRLRAKSLMLAAGTLATTSLALRRVGLTGVRIRLESNPVGAVAFVVPRFIGCALPERTFGLGQLFYTLDVEHGVEAAGVLYGADALPLAAVADRLPFTRPAALRAARALAPALVLATAYLPGRFSDNSLTVDDGARGRVLIGGMQSADAQRLLVASLGKLTRLARARGAWPVPGSSQVLAPGADAHPAGTLPLGGTGPAATTADGELKGAPGVFIADGAALPVLSARHPTLTIMANADRIGRRLASRLVGQSGVARAG